MTSPVTISKDDQAKGPTDGQAGSKHKSEHAEPRESKRTKTSKGKEQQTLEESLGDTGKEEEDLAAPPAPETENSAIEPNGRADKMPSNVLEKGIIYFFFRRRVGVSEEAEGVEDVARTYFILRPLDTGDALGDGPIGDDANARLCALPKKVFPQSDQDRFMAFVEKAGVSFGKLHDEFLDASEPYETKTAGSRQVPAATPVGEGVYVVTTTGRESHLVYMLTLPEEMGDVQEEVGLRKKGSFTLSTKNPQIKGPAIAQLPETADFSEEIQKEFGSLRWLPTQPRHLDFPNAQFLLIGESLGVEKATEPKKKDDKAGKATPAEELETLHDEDLGRMKGLHEDDAASIYADLEVRMAAHGKLPKLQKEF